MGITNKVLRFFLLEIRDWVFAIVGIIAMITLPQINGAPAWFLALLAATFITLYIMALFASSKLLQEHSNGKTSDD